MSTGQAKRTVAILAVGVIGAAIGAAVGALGLGVCAAVACLGYLCSEGYCGPNGAGISLMYAGLAGISAAVLGAAVGGALAGGLAARGASSEFPTDRA